MTELDRYYLHAQLLVPDVESSGVPVGAFVRGRAGVTRISEDHGVVRIEREQGPTLVIVGLNVGVEAQKPTKVKP